MSLSYADIIISKPCKNPLQMYPHDILPGRGVKPMELLGYCGVCAKLAFTDNCLPTNPDVSKQTFKQAGTDTL
jgi:hypothetical protein